LKSLTELRNALATRSASLTIHTEEDEAGEPLFSVWLFAADQPSFILSTDEPNADLLWAVNDLLEQWDKMGEGEPEGVET
jgi:hypothetical protein